MRKAAIVVHKRRRLVLLLLLTASWSVVVEAFPIITLVPRYNKPLLVLPSSSSVTTTTQLQSTKNPRPQLASQQKQQQKAPYCNQQDLQFINSILSDIEEIPPWRSFTPLKTVSTFVWLLTRTPQQPEAVLQYMLQQQLLLTTHHENNTKNDTTIWFNKLLKQFPPATAERLLDTWKEYSHLVPPDTVSYNTVISLYAQAGRMKDAQRLFDALPQRDGYSYSALLGGYRRVGNVERAEQLYQELLDDPDCCNGSTIHVAENILLHCYVQGRQLERALTFLKTLSRPQPASYNIVLTGYLYHKSLSQAQTFFDSIPTKDDVTYTTMVDVYCSHSDPVTAIEQIRILILHDLPRVWFTSKVISNVLYSVATLDHREAVPLAEELVAKWTQAHDRGSLELYNALLHCYAKARGDPTTRILQILDHLESNRCRLTPTIKTYTAALDGIKDIDKAYQLLRKLQLHGPQPTVQTYTCLMAKIARSQRFEKVHQVQELFMEVKEQDTMQPTLITYNTVLNACEHTPDPSPEILQIACDCFGELRHSGMRPNHVSYGSFLSVIGRLMEKGTVRDDLIRIVWDFCKSNGQVSPLVVRKLQMNYEGYDQLLEGHDPDDLPLTWTKNVRNDKSRRYQ